MKYIEDMSYMNGSRAVNKKKMPQKRYALLKEHTKFQEYRPLVSKTTLYIKHFKYHFY